METKLSYKKPLLLNFSYTPTELKQKSADIFNQVQESNMVIIKSATRPEMLLMKKSVLENERAEYEKKITLLIEGVKHLESK